MRSTGLVRMAIPLAALLCAWPSHTQADDSDVYWHIDPSVKTCSMVIDPSLTQAQWETYTREVGAIAGFKSLSSAAPLGTRHFTVGVTYSTTPVDQHDPAWINTFTHPDASCPLGDRIALPTIRASLGVSRTMDVAGFWTTAPGANYGALGGEFKYAFLRESTGVPAAAVSTSFAMLTGVPDYNISIYSVGLLASKRVAMFTPYLGVRELLAVGTETTSKANLNTESLAVPQGVVGSTVSMGRFGLAAEYNVAAVNTFALMVNVHSGGDGHP